LLVTYGKPKTFGYFHSAENTTPGSKKEKGFPKWELFLAFAGLLLLAMDITASPFQLCFVVLFVTGYAVLVHTFKKRSV
jgi:hypothetical protein